MHKILLIALLLCSALATPLGGNAQATPAQSPVPQLLLSSLTLPQSSYVAGDNISGSFILENKGKAIAQNIYYRISLNKYTGGTVAEQYDSITLGPVTLTSLEKKTIPFTYRLPAAFSGDLGIQVRALFEKSYPLSWDDRMITVTGGKPSASVSKAVIVADGVEYPLQAGPTAYKSVYINGFLLPNGETITVIPRIKISNRANKTENPYASTTEAIKIAAGKGAPFSIKLPTFDFKEPGVYEGELSFPDSTGTPRAPIQSFRYILGGDIATLYSVFSSKPEVKKNEKFFLKVNYAGAPYDIVTGEPVGNPESKTRLAVFVYDENSTQVAEADVSVDYNSGTELFVPLVATGDAKGLRAELRAYGTNGTIATLSSVISTPKPGTNSALFSIDFLAKAILPVALILAALLALWRFRSKPALRKTLALVFMFGSFASFSGSASAEWTVETTGNYSKFCEEGGIVDPYLDKHPPGGKKFSQRDCYFSNDMLPDVVYVLKGTNGETLSEENMTPGQKFTVVGTAILRRCGNSPSKMVYTYSFGDVAEKTKKGKAKIIPGQKGTAFKEATGEFVLTGPVDGKYFQIPENPPDSPYNVYTFNLTVKNEQSLGGLLRWGTVEGYITLTVGVEPPEIDDPDIDDVVGKPVGYLEYQACSGGSGVVSGWACNPTTPGDQLEVFIADYFTNHYIYPDQDYPVGSVTAGIPGAPGADADGIAAQCGGTSAHRFSWAFTLGPDGDIPYGNHLFTAYADGSDRVTSLESPYEPRYERLTNISGYTNAISLPSGTTLLSCPLICSAPNEIPGGEYDSQTMSFQECTCKPGYDDYGDGLGCVPPPPVDKCSIQPGSHEIVDPTDPTGESCACEVGYDYDNSVPQKCVPFTCPADQLVDSSDPDPLNWSCVCPGSQVLTEGLYGVERCEDIVYECTNLPIAFCPERAGETNRSQMNCSTEEVPEGYYQREGTFLCEKEIDCAAGTNDAANIQKYAVCDVGVCDADGYRHLDPNSCSFPDYCSSESIEELEELFDDIDTLSCESEEGSEVFESDIDFEADYNAAGSCSLSWNVREDKDGIPQVRCSITTEDTTPEPIDEFADQNQKKQLDYVNAASGQLLKNMQNVAGPIVLGKVQSGTKYTISCGRDAFGGFPAQKKLATKTVSCEVKNSPKVKEI